MDDDHRDDKGFQRFFCYLNLFTFSMLVLVLADNLPLLFLGWEGVGLCSYLLIGFWYSDTWNAYCGSKAFIVNRIGDFGFLLGFFFLFWALAGAGTPTASFRGIEEGFATIAGQTPVSALIHAATMVTAGVYLVCRMHFLYVEAIGASTVIAWIGGLTAIF